MKMHGMEIADAVVRDAVEEIAETLVNSEDVLGHMTCAEIDKLARSLALLGMQDEGEELVLTHALTGDGQGDEGHGSVIADDGVHFIAGSRTAVRVHVEALCAGRVEPGTRMDDEG